MKQLLHRSIAATSFLYFLGTAGSNLAVSQPTVKAWGWDDSLAVVQLTEQYLTRLEVQKEGLLIVHLSARLPKRLQGMTFRLDTLKSNACPIIKVVINARVNATQRQLVLAHEMVHVKQILSGELEISEGWVRWKGKNYRYQWGAERYRAPWESEAHRLDNQLAKESLLQPLMASNPPNHHH